MASRGVVSAVLLHRHDRRCVSRCRGELRGHSLSLKRTCMPCLPAHAHCSSWKVLTLDRLAGVGAFNGPTMVWRQWFWRYPFLFYHIQLGRILSLGNVRKPSRAHSDRCFKPHTLHACAHSDACACSERGHVGRTEDPWRAREAIVYENRSV